MKRIKTMAYNELIKNFNGVRSYMRDFYVYGFKSRDEFNKKSLRLYDDEKRRIESWLGEYMGFRYTKEGKNIFLSIDSRAIKENPLYKALKAKSFTDADITLHFIILDILHDSKETYTLNEIVEKIDEYLLSFENPKIYDKSTIRKKLNEYVKEGLIKTEKVGRSYKYSRADDEADFNMDSVKFFSEVAPCGVLGSYILDKNEEENKEFTFKHHYITSAMDSEILCKIQIAILEKRKIALYDIGIEVVPLKICVSLRSGRQYLMAFNIGEKRLMSYRLDNIEEAKLLEILDNYEQYSNILEKHKDKIWGVSLGSSKTRSLEKVTFTITYEDDEQHIYNRLLREKRCGMVERLSKNSSRFTAEVFDSGELVPWIRTFICRITEIEFSNKELEKQFKRDMEGMYKIYDI